MAAGRRMPPSSSSLLLLLLLLSAGGAGARRRGSWFEAGRAASLRRHQLQRHTVSARSSRRADLPASALPTAPRLPLPRHTPDSLSEPLSSASPSRLASGISCCASAASRGRQAGSWRRCGGASSRLGRWPCGMRTLVGSCGRGSSAGLGWLVQAMRFPRTWRFRVVRRAPALHPASGVEQRRVCIALAACRCVAAALGCRRGLGHSCR